MARRNGQASLEVPAGEAETLQEQMKHMTARHLSKQRTDLLNQVTLTVLKSPLKLSILSVKKHYKI